MFEWELISDNISHDFLEGRWGSFADMDRLTGILKIKQTEWEIWPTHIASLWKHL